MRKFHKATLPEQLEIVLKYFVFLNSERYGSEARLLQRRLPVYLVFGLSTLVVGILLAWIG